MLTVDKPVVVLRIEGELDLDNQHHLEREVLERLRSGSVVMDCSALDFLSISALRSLRVCSIAADEVGHRFVVARPSRQARRLLALAGMEDLLQCSERR